MKKFNIYKFISRVVMVLFVVLSTIQTLLDVSITFNTAIDANIFIAATAASIIPIIILFTIMNLVSRKTKHVNLFVIPEIKFIIRTLVYLSLLSIFTLWPVLLISALGIYGESLLAFGDVSHFLLERVAHSIVYSGIVALFFYGISDIKLKRRKNELQ